MRTVTYSIVLASLISLASTGCGKIEDAPHGNSSSEAVAAPQSGEWTLGAPIVMPPQSPGSATGQPAPRPMSPQAPGAPTQPWGQPSAASGSNLFVVLGGNGSCSASGLSDILPGLTEARLFRAFNDAILKIGLVTPADQVIFGCYEWMSSEMKFYELKGQQTMQPLHEAQLDTLVLARAQTARKITIIGHSYGGWRAMKLASSPNLINNLRTPMILVTFDPISKVMCQRIREAGCREAPSDLSQAEFYQLNTRTRWLNIYQEKGFLLGSGPMAAAHFNIKARARHLDIQTEEEVWDAVARFVWSFLMAP